MVFELGAEEDAHAENFAKMQSEHALLFSVVRHAARVCVVGGGSQAALR